MLAKKTDFFGESKGLLACSVAGWRVRARRHDSALVAARRLERAAVRDKGKWEISFAFPLGRVNNT